MAREFLYIVQESAYGTPVGSPVVGTSSIYIRLDGGNAFSMVGDPIFYDIAYGGGLAVNAITGSDQAECVGNLTTKLYGSQAVFLSNWFAQRINTGQTSPWTTTEPAGDLASCSVYHGVARSDGTVKRIQYAGVKVYSWKIDCSRDSKVATLSLGLRGQKWNGNGYDASSDPNSSVFPAPTDTQLPTDPFRFIDLAGNFTIGSSRSQFSSISLSCTNAMDARWFENRFLSVCRWLGRKTTLDASLFYKPTPDDLTDYQNVTVKSASVAFNNGTNSLTINMNGANYFRKITKKLDVDKVYELPVNVTNNWDNSAGADLTVSAA